MADPSAAMTALVEFQIRADETNMDDWLDEWQKRAQDALEAEPETTAYAAAVSLDDESSVLIYERYAQGTASLNFHVERPSHAELTETMGARRMTKRRVMSLSCVDVPNFGWWGRDDNTRIQSGAIFSISALRFGDDEQRSDAIRMSQEHAEYCWREEPDTLIYGGGIAVRDADRGPEIKQGDFIFIMACTDLAAVEKHSQDPRHLALGPVFAKTGIKTTFRFNKKYRTTGHGFLAKAV